MWERQLWKGVGNLLLLRKLKQKHTENTEGILYAKRGDSRINNPHTNESPWVYIKS